MTCCFLCQTLGIRGDGGPNEDGRALRGSRHANQLRKHKQGAER